MTGTGEWFPDTRCTVLLVEDVYDSREMSALFLRAAGYAVHEAADGGEALAMALEFRPDVIVMDLSLPSMDGLTAIAKLSATPRRAESPLSFFPPTRSRPTKGAHVKRGRPPFSRSPAPRTSLPAWCGR